ncbi:MAG: hypoxanthine phosphoribosyltransferase [Saprospiraceae bacterium]|nr:hypoxanthine phosphoribosyltransferase [Saprospiraceae bacterium]
MNELITLNDKTFEIYLTEAEIQARVKALADRINVDYKGRKPIVLCILNGSFIFTADLVRHFNFPLTVEFVRYSSYRGTESTGRVTKILGMKSEIAGKDVLIVEDIIDTGYTLSNAVKELMRQHPASVKIASLLLKPEALKHDVACNYIGFSIPNKFVVGYGLDYDELGRDLPSIYQLKE